jgi:hypothetical protein
MITRVPYTGLRITVFKLKEETLSFNFNIEVAFSLKFNSAVTTNDVVCLRRKAGFGENGASEESD